MTEMGLGGVVDCEARRGYHMREADLYVEIVDPRTGEAVSDGETGEVVFTTLTRGPCRCCATARAI
jgi:phenylacetate-CoA ligase